MYVHNEIRLQSINHASKQMALEWAKHEIVTGH